MNRSATFALFVVLAGCNLSRAGKDNDAGSAAAPADAAPAVTAAAPVDAGATPVAMAKKPEPAKASGSKVPTCTKGQQLGSVALSPLTPFCGATCKTNADCKGTACLDVNMLGPDGMPPKGGGYGKICSAEKLDPSAAPAGSPASKDTPPKCKATEHYDDINKKCRPLGDCPKGYRWNDPMQSCVMDG